MVITGETDEVAEPKVKKRLNPSESPGLRFHGVPCFFNLTFTGAQKIGSQVFLEVCKFKIFKN